MSAIPATSFLVDGDTASKTGPKPKPPDERFWALVDLGGPGECWEWTGYRDRKGYGRFQMGRKVGVVKAHRFAAGALGTDLHVMHTCDNPPCVNPAHLRLGTLAENNADMASKGRAFRAPGELNRNAKLSNADASDIRLVYAAGGVSMRALGRRYGVSGTTIKRIVNWESYA